MTEADDLQRAWDAGAKAMQDRVLVGLRLWWERARSPTRPNTWPGHPHWLEVKVRELKPEDLEGRP